MDQIVVTWIKLILFLNYVDFTAVIKAKGFEPTGSKPFATWLLLACCCNDHLRYRFRL